MELKIKNLEDTKRLAVTLADAAVPGTVILLNGDLGAGKTQFSQFFGAALGVTSIINSPTFNIIKSYEGRIPFHHMDCYRLEGAEDDLGFEEYFYGDGVCIVEWPEMIEDFLPESYLEMTIKRNLEDLSDNESTGVINSSNNLNEINSESRYIQMNAIGPSHEKLLEDIMNETVKYRHE